MPVTETLELDLSGALGSIGQLDTALSEVSTAFSSSLAGALTPLENVQIGEVDATAVGEAVSGALEEASATPVEVTADTTEAQASIDAIAAEPIDVPVDADTSLGEANVADFAALAEGLAPVITVDADVSAAEAEIENLAALAQASDASFDVQVDTGDSGAQLDDLSGSLTDTSQAAESAGQSAGGAGSSIVNLGTIAGGTRGGVEGMSEAIGKVAGTSAGMVKGVGAAAAAVGLLFHAGEQAAAGVERLELVFGNLSADVQSIDVGGLTGDLGKLATESGNSATALREATATIGQMAISSGAGRRAAADFAETVAALSLSATAMNPNLGEAGDVAGRLSTALARGGKFAAQFGISLTSAEINLRAMGNTGKSSAADLTVVEKAMAGAQLAAEKAGNSIGTDFNRGVEQGAVQIKRFEQEIKGLVATLGAPLVEPFLDAMKGLEPVIAGVANVLRTLGPLFEVGVKAALLWNPVTVGFRVLGEVLQRIEPLIGGIGSAIGAIGDTVTGAFGGIEVSAKQLSAAVDNLKGKVGKDLTGAFKDLQDIVAVDQFGTLAGSVGSTTQKFIAFKQILDEGNFVLAAKLLPTLGLTAAEEERFGAALDKASEKAISHNRAIDTVIGGLGRIDAAIRSTAPNFDLLALAIGRQQAPFQAFEAAARSAADSLPTLGSLLGQAAADVQKFTGALDPTLVTAHLGDIFSEFQTFFTNVNTIAQEGFTNLSTALLQIGPEAGSALAQALASGTVEERAALDAKLTQISDAMFQIQVELQVAADKAKAVAGAIGAGIGDELVAAFGKTNFGELSSIPLDELNRMSGLIQNVVPVVAKSFELLGLNSKDAYQRALDLVTGTQTAVDGAKAAAEGSDLPPAVGEIGKRSADSFESAIDHVPTAAERAWVLATGTARNNVGPATEGGKAVGEGTKHGHEQGLQGMELDAQTAAGKAIAAAVAEGTRGTGLMAEAGRALSRGFTNGITEGSVAAGAAGLALVTAVEAGTRNTGLMAGAGTALASAFTAAVQAAATLATAAGLALVTAVEAGTRNTGLMAGSGAALVAAFAAAVTAGAFAATAAGLALVNAVAAGVTTGSGVLSFAGAAAGLAFASGVSASAGNALIAGVSLANAVASGVASAAGTMSLAGAAAGLAFASGVSASAGNALIAGQSLASAAAAGAAGGAGAASASGATVGLAFASGLSASAGNALIAGQSVGQAGAQGAASQTGVMSEAGGTVGLAFESGLRASAGNAFNAGVSVADAAASGGTSANGAMSSAGASAALAFASGVSAGAGNAFIAGQSLARAAAAGAASGGSPTEHLFTDLAHELGEAFATGLQDKIRTGQAAGVEFARSTADAFGTELERAIREQVDSAIATMNAQLTAANIAPVGGGASASNLDSQLRALVSKVGLGDLRAGGASGNQPITLGDITIPVNVDARGATDPQAVADLTGAAVATQIRSLIRTRR